MIACAFATAAATLLDSLVREAGDRPAIGENAIGRPHAHRAWPRTSELGLGESLLDKSLGSRLNGWIGGA